MMKETHLRATHRPLLLVGLLLIAFVSCTTDKTKALVTLDFNGGSLAGAQSQKMIMPLGQETRVVAVPESSQGTFIGWATVKGDSSTVMPGHMICPEESPVTYYAFYSEYDCKVTFDANGGMLATGSSQTTVTRPVGAVILDTYVPDDPTWGERKFLGWTTTRNDASTIVLGVDKKYSKSWRVMKSQTLYAMWRNEGEVKITLDYTLGRCVNGDKMTSPYLFRRGELINAFWESDIWESGYEPYCFKGVSDKPLYAGSLDFEGITTKKGDRSTLIDFATYTLPLDSPDEVTLYAYWYPRLVNVPGGTLKAGKVWGCDGAGSDEASVVYPRAKSDFTMPNTKKAMGETNPSRLVIPNTIGSSSPFEVAYSIAEHPVTQGMWYTVVHGNRITTTPSQGQMAGVIREDATFQMCDTHLLNSVPTPVDPQVPVVGHTWADCVIFCNMLTQLVFGDTSQCYYNISKITTNALGTKAFASKVEFGSPEFYPDRKGFRLPTEAEWEWAARGGVPDNHSAITATTKAEDIEKVFSGWSYNFAGTPRVDSSSMVAMINTSDVNYYDGQGRTSAGKQDGYVQALKGVVQNAGGSTLPLNVTATRVPNSLGLMNMCGNVKEWVWDMASTSSTENQRRVRGGSNATVTAYELSLGYRDSRNMNTAANSDISFRIASSGRAMEVTNARYTR